MSLSKIIGLSAVLHLYLGIRLVPSLPLPAGIALAVLLLASAVLVPAGLLARRLLRDAAADRLTWVGMLFMGLFSSLFVLTVLRDVLLLVLHLAGRTGWNEPTAAGVRPLALGTSSTAMS